MVRATVAQILLDRRATATGPGRGDVIQRLALLDAWLDDEPRPLPEGPADGPA
jgi:hypothetical protein